MSTNNKLTKASRVFQSLQTDIINGELKEGAKLQMDFLKEKYQVGYSPLREALSRLMTQGLVELEEHCGFKVSAMSLKDFHDLYMLRMHIDTLALELSIENGTDTWEAEVVSHWHQFSKYTDPQINSMIDENKWYQLQKNFLMTLIKGCDSPWLLKISNMLYDQAVRYRMLCLQENFHKKKWRTDYIQQKEQIVKAILSRDKKKAVQLAHKNWNQTIKIINAILKNKLMLQK